MKQRATLPVSTASVTGDTRAIVRFSMAVSARLAVRAGLLVGMVYAGRMFRMMTFIILVCQSNREKPEAGSLTQTFRAEIAIARQYKHACQAQGGGISEAIRRRKGSAPGHLLRP